MLLRKVILIPGLPLIDIITCQTRELGAAPYTVPLPHGFQSSWRNAHNGCKEVTISVSDPASMLPWTWERTWSGTPLISRPVDSSAAASECPVDFIPAPAKECAAKINSKRLQLGGAGRLSHPALARAVRGNSGVPSIIPNRETDFEIQLSASH